MNLIELAHKTLEHCQIQYLEQSYSYNFVFRWSIVAVRRQQNSDSSVVVSYIDIAGYKRPPHPCVQKQMTIMIMRAVLWERVDDY